MGFQLQISAEHLHGQKSCSGHNWLSGRARGVKTPMGMRGIFRQEQREGTFPFLRLQEMALTHRKSAPWTQALSSLRGGGLHRCQQRLPLDSRSVTLRGHLGPESCHLLPCCTSRHSLSTNVCSIRHLLFADPILVLHTSLGSY